MAFEAILAGWMIGFIYESGDRLEAKAPHLKRGGALRPTTGTFTFDTATADAEFAF